MTAMLIHVLIIVLAVVVQLVNWLLYRRTRAAAQLISDRAERQRFVQRLDARIIFTGGIIGALYLFQVAQQLGRLIAGSGVEMVDIVWLVTVAIGITGVIYSSRQDRRDLLQTGQVVSTLPSSAD